MEAIRSSDTSVFTRATQRNILNDGILQRPIEICVQESYHCLLAHCLSRSLSSRETCYHSVNYRLSHGVLNIIIGLYSS
jgi:hypothetical protein